MQIIEYILKRTLLKAWNEHIRRVYNPLDDMCQLFLCKFVLGIELYLRD